VVAEEAGFIGVAVVIVLFILLVFQGFVIAFRAADLFGTLLAGGLTMLIALEASINISAVVGLIPTKGLALPFMSYGGSSLVMSLAAVGILLSIQADRSKVRVILAGGRKLKAGCHEGVDCRRGTGGHLFPGVAIAEEFLRRNGNSQVLFIGTERVLRHGS